MNNAVSKKKTAEIIPFSSMFEEDKSKGFELVNLTATPRIKVYSLYQRKRRFRAKGDI